jgi:hypothetical protein
MTVAPEISEKVLAYALGFVRKAVDQTRPRRAAGEGEQQAQKLTLGELMAYCDETHEEKIRAYPGAGTRLQKIVCLAMAAAAVLFVVSVFSGTATAASVAIVLSFCGAGLFIYRFFSTAPSSAFSPRAAPPPTCSANAMRGLSRCGGWYWSRAATRRKNCANRFWGPPRRTC